ncbi:MAG: low temperature requirement protein A [Ornithinimicrobium sp.]
MAAKNPPITRYAVMSALAGFATMFLLWWLYFDYRQGNAKHEVDDDTDTTAAARGAYAYAHPFMAGGRSWSPSASKKSNATHSAKPRPWWLWRSLPVRSSTRWPRRTAPGSPCQ